MRNCRRELLLQQWERIRANPTLYRHAFAPDESPWDFHWHRAADRENSSQAFCVSAFHTLRHIRQRDRVIHNLLVPFYPEVAAHTREPRQWVISLEKEHPSLLGELGGSQPTSIDVLFSSSQEVICVESKFVADATTGFGRCSQFHAERGKQPHCRGFYGPGSDARTGTGAWCRLETWEGQRSPRLYWLLGRQFFQPQVFDRQEFGGICPLRDGNYQLMRNFLFAAALAQQTDRPFFEVIVICPDCMSGVIRQQVATFKTSILLPEFTERVQLVTYEKYIDVLRGCGSDAVELADFLDRRIKDREFRGSDLVIGPCSISACARTE